MSDQAKAVYLVVMDRSGIFGAWLDRDRAHEAARNIEGVVCELPIVADYTSDGREAKEQA